jgi:YHS domain-containing protein
MDDKVGNAVTRDLVCGMTVAPETAGHTAEHGGTLYYFCSAGCRAKFVSDPDRYLRLQPMEDSAPESLAWRDYIPLGVIVGLIFLASAVLASRNVSPGAFRVRDFVSYFMTGFFLVFAGFKLLDMKGFAEGYSTYDLLARQWFGYGYLYPFIELSFGLAMLAGLTSAPLLWLEFAVMAFSGIGVAIKLARGERFQCACLGTFLKVPLTKVTLVEDFGMAALALWLLVL